MDGEILAHNATVLLQKDVVLKEGIRLCAGIYRVIVDEVRLNRSGIVHIGSLEGPKRTGHGGRKRTSTEHCTHKRKKDMPGNVGTVIWAARTELIAEINACNLRAVQIQRDKNLSAAVTEGDKRHRKIRRAVGSMLLDYAKLEASLLSTGNLGGMVAEIMKATEVSKGLVYKVWSNLCRWGFTEDSLLLRRAAGGAPGVPRRVAHKPDPSDRWPRKKAGRRTEKERLEVAGGHPIDPEQPGMSEEWVAQILAADRLIPSPKPPMPVRVTKVLEMGFHAVEEVEPGKYKYVLPRGAYPNRPQVRRVLFQGAIAWCKQQVSARTFEHRKRAHVGHAYNGVGGPGHQWLIDSTVGDLYLRSSLNRAWIVGRPIVYVIVDTWSTAVVGFHVCLEGPKWTMASVALFNATVGETTLAELLGADPLPLLDPQPAFFFDLLADRGEYLSKAERAIALNLKFKSSYTRAYTPYLHGAVEVLHRIAKDKMYHFVPGAFDMRKEEFLQCKRAIELSVMTLNEFRSYLHILFYIYNHTGDRSTRLDAMMIASKVAPTAAGLWKWGHEAGLAYRKFVPQDDLIWKLLPSVEVKVNRDGIFHAGCEYAPDSAEERVRWATFAKNFGAYKFDGRYFPGAMRSVWIREAEGSPLKTLRLLDESRAAPDMCCEEWLDSLSLERLQRPGHAHDNQAVLGEMQALLDRLVRNATAATAEAVDRVGSDSIPPITVARSMEAGLEAPQGTVVAAIENARPALDLAIALALQKRSEQYQDVMSELLASANPKS